MTAPQTIVFRVDSSHAAGTGHMARCRTLAAVLRERGCHVRFLCRDNGAAHVAAVLRDGFAVTFLDPAKTPPSPEQPYGAWLGTTEAEDAAATVASLKGRKPDWLVVDHYALSAAWENAVKPAVGRILAIDDIAREHACDIVLDQNFSLLGTARYAASKGARILSGPRYALLGPEYRAARQLLPPREGRPRRVAVFFGGADTVNMTGTALEALSAPAFAALEVIVVLGLANVHGDKLRAQAAQRPNTIVYDSAPTLAPLFLHADIAVGAGGATTWERCALGLPSVVVSIAANQEPACRDLAEAGLIRYAGAHTEISAARLGDEIAAVLDAPETSKAMSAAGKALVDGWGAVRVAEEIAPGMAADITPLLPSNADIVHLAIRGLPLGHVAFQNDGADITAAMAADPLATERGWESVLLLEALRFRTSLTAPAYLKTSAAAAGLRICIATDRTSWINRYLAPVVLGWLDAGHRVLWTHDASQLQAGDICFYLSFSRLVPAAILALFRNNIVIHASDLPKGRGWSPSTWQILEGADRIPMTLFEAVEAVDAGRIYLQEWLPFEGHELLGELHDAIGASTARLCAQFVAGYPDIVATGREQRGDASFYPRRRAEDSRLDIDQPLRAQFPLLRVVDNINYPAFFELAGQKFELLIKKARS